MNLDVGFVEESSVADVTVVHHLLALITLTRRAGPSSSSSSSTAGAEQTLEEEKFHYWDHNDLNIRPSRSLMGGRRPYNEVTSLVRIQLRLEMVCNSKVSRGLGAPLYVL